MNTKINTSVFTFTTALVAASLFTAASAQAEGSAEAFITDALQTSLAEVNMGKLAEQNSQNPNVQKFGTMMRNDHSKAYYTAANIAQSSGQPIATEPTEDQQKTYRKLEQLKGVQFDRAFTEAMIEGHQDTIKKFEKEARLKDGAASTYAKETLPTLRSHLAAAKKLAGGS